LNETGLDRINKDTIRNFVNLVTHPYKALFGIGTNNLLFVGLSN